MTSIIEIISYLAIMLGIILVGFFVFNAIDRRKFEKDMLPYLILGVLLIVTGLIPS
jgi:membrane protein DedA with SNARE-associated domain